MFATFVAAILTVLVGSPHPARAQTAGGGGFSAEAFDAWVAARIGTGAPVYWYSEGTVRKYPSGELVARMEGFDTARRVAGSAPGRVDQLSRKTYIYRDPKSGARLTAVNGVALPSIKYSYQHMSYWLDGEQLMSTVTQGVGKGVRTLGPSGGMAAEKIGDTWAFTAPVYLDWKTPNGGAYQAFENYDFFINPAGTVSQPNQLSWVRYGDLPPALGGGPGIMHMVSWRVNSFDALPEPIKDYVRAEAPLWLAPPKDVAEIKAIQALAAEKDVQGFGG